jgi:hypothetical protein
LTLADLAVRHAPHLVANVLAEEVRAGRVVRDLDGYRLVEERFPADVLAALRALGPPDPDHSRPVKRSRLSVRPTGELARAFA